MIIIGYQGIGKSMVAGKDNIIDLESSNFYNNDVRPDDWYIYYCNIANELSNQGYIVCVSSHKEVRDYLYKHSCEKVVTICPDRKLKDAWIKKLEDRYNRTHTEKDKKAWLNAVDRYEDNIIEIMLSGFDNYTIQSMNYNLQTIINNLRKTYHAH